MPRWKGNATVRCHLKWWTGTAAHFFFPRFHNVRETLYYEIYYTVKACRAGRQASKSRLSCRSQEARVRTPGAAAGVPSRIVILAWARSRAFPEEEEIELAPSMIHAAIECRESWFDQSWIIWIKRRAALAAKGEREIQIVKVIHVRLRRGTYRTSAPKVMY